MNRTPHRPRRYIPRPLLMLLRPVFRYSLARDAYVLRAVGDSHGPVLCRERRRRVREFAGPERRHHGVVVG